MKEPTHTPSMSGPATGTLATSSAVVQVYAGNNLVRIVNVPTDHVRRELLVVRGRAERSDGCVFTLINEFHATPPVGAALPASATKPVVER